MNDALYLECSLLQIPLPLLYRSDDPWANHIRGMAPTPLEEGNDPLSSASKDPPTQSTPLSSKIVGSRKAVQRLDSGSLEASWGAGRDDTEDSNEESRPIPPPHDVELTNNESVSETRSNEDSEDEDEQFVYPGQQFEAREVSSIDHLASRRTELGKAPEQPSTQIELDSPSTNAAEELVASSSINSQPVKPIYHSRLSTLCSQGPLSALQSFFQVTTSSPPAGSNVSSFALANEPNPASGLVPIHYAAREGKIEILKWLVKETGALIGMEDREGEVSEQQCRKQEPG